MLQVESYVAGQWLAPDDSARGIDHAITGQLFARAGRADIDFGAMVGFARERGGAALRAMTFHQRARLLKALALHLSAHKQQLYELSFATGGTQSDHVIDIDGGIGTLFVYASKGVRELPDDRLLLDGDSEQLGKTGQFLGQHVYSSKQGLALHINAFNFPVWGMLEKLAPSLLAGVPSVVKPATASCYVTEACVRLMLDSGLLPDGALQLVTGGLGDSLALLDCQDSVTFTGSAATADLLRQSPGLRQGGASFSAEQDSLNAAILGPDATPDRPEFELFLKEVVREMTVKAGQKCTAIRRIFAPADRLDAVITGLSVRLGKVTVGDPRAEGVRMGALISRAQREDVLARAAELATEAECVFGGQDGFRPVGADLALGAFVAPTLYHCADPARAQKVHAVEAFGPVSTVMPYADLDDALALANRGGGSLVASLFTRDAQVARQAVLGMGAFHGRLYFNNRDSQAEATTHGSPMPHLVHGGPGRAGGGEELGGIRGVKHFMQRSAVQGSPALLSGVTGRWLPGAPEIDSDRHPFRCRFGELALGQRLRTAARTVTLVDIEQFADFTGDRFYAHMDAEAAARNPFFPGRVAHGYLLISFAAGLFVDPGEGPVLANNGLDRLRFTKPVEPGDSISAELVVMQKSPRAKDYGEVRWQVWLRNQQEELVASYELLTMVAL